MTSSARSDAKYDGRYRKLSIHRSCCGTGCQRPLASSAFGNVATALIVPAQTLTLHNTGNAPLTGITYTFTAGYARRRVARRYLRSCPAL